MKPYLFFDMDGTLLRMDVLRFSKAYTDTLYRYLSQFLVLPDFSLFSRVCWEGFKKMKENDGSMTNKERFFSYFFSQIDCEREPLVSLFYRYHEEKFDEISYTCERNPQAIEAIHRLKKEGYSLTLASNPCFARSAMIKRLHWAGLEESDFDEIYDFDCFSVSKPNPEFFKEVLRRRGKKATDSLMIGNDVDEDMVSREVGMKVFLLNDQIINRSNKDISSYPQGDYDDLFRYLAFLTDVSDCKPILES